MVNLSCGVLKFKTTIPKRTSKTIAFTVTPTINLSTTDVTGCTQVKIHLPPSTEPVMTINLDQVKPLATAPNLTKELVPIDASNNRAL
jgi:hypothetical protein